jgi:release factor glutamine methyltransferase
VDQTIFCGLPIRAVAGQVMKPRPASEQLVATALDFIGDRPARVVDVGTGSGALAIAISSAAPRAVVWATDTSRDAVSVARENVRLYGLEDRITVCEGDLLEPVPGLVDLVIANLPYLPAADDALHPELATEPADAVYAKGDGLEPYRRLLDTCADRLSENGEVALQLHRRVFGSKRAELLRLRVQIEVAQQAALSRSRRALLAAAA